MKRLESYIPKTSPPSLLQMLVLPLQALCSQNQAGTDPQMQSLNEIRNVNVAGTRQVFILGLSYPFANKTQSQDHLPGWNLRSQLRSAPLRK